MPFPLEARGWYDFFLIAMKKHNVYWHLKHLRLKTVQVLVGYSKWWKYLVHLQRNVLSTCTIRIFSLTFLMHKTVRKFLLRDGYLKWARTGKQKHTFLSLDGFKTNSRQKKLAKKNIKQHNGWATPVMHISHRKIADKKRYPKKFSKCWR